MKNSATNNASNPKTWKKVGTWRPASQDGPVYYSLDDRARIIGFYGTTGDNMRGWRKRQFYTLYIDGKQVVTSSISVQKLMVKYAETSNV